MIVETNQNASKTSAKHRWVTHLALLLILAIAFAIRLHDIGRESLWSDEVLTHHIATKPLGQLFYDVAKFEQIPPVHHLIVHVWIKLFGDSEAALRFPSLLAGVASVWVIYLLGRRLVGTTGALVAALLLAVSPFHIIYAHEARAYTLMVLMGLLSTLAFLRLIERSSIKREVAYVLSSALLLYVHLYGGFALAAHQMAFLVYFWRVYRDDENAHRLAAAPTRRADDPTNQQLSSADETAQQSAAWARGLNDESPARITLTRWITLSFAIAMLFAPYLPTVRTWFKSVGVNFWVKKASWDDVSYAFNVYSGSVAIYVICIALLVIGVRALSRGMGVSPMRFDSREHAPKISQTADKKGVRSLFFRSHPTADVLRARPDRAFTISLLLSLLLLPMILPVLYSVLRTPVFSPRYGILASTALYLLTGAGVAALKPLALRVLLVGVLAGLSLVAKPVDPWKAHWREVGDYLAARMRPGDLAIVHIKASARQYDYYVGRRRPDVPRIGFDGSAAPLSLPLTPGRHVWFVNYGRFAPPQKILDRGNWRVLSSKWFPDGIVVMELDDDELAVPNDE